MASNTLTNQLWSPFSLSLKVKIIISILDNKAYFACKLLLPALNLFLREALGQFHSPCASLQLKCHFGVFAQAEKDGSVLSYPDAGGGEPGESRAEEPCAHLGQGEGSGSQQHPENPNTPAELLHGVSLGSDRASCSFSSFSGSVNKILNLGHLGSR